jgi:sRNA-binding carbon storage regulator CsrA
MLVIPRKKGEVIVIGDEDILVSVEDILVDRVRIGIECSRSSSVVAKIGAGQSEDALSPSDDPGASARWDG